MSREVIRQSFIRHDVSVDLGIVEGGDGLYDGVDQAGSGSTAEVAKAIQAPVILVVDAECITRSVAAMVMGFIRFELLIWRSSNGYRKYSKQGCLGCYKRQL
ncbi:hypothetical protein [Desulfosporosinus nitroreducens]|uniref:Uncharacterized protein n=1 Tax=Desulfosporosinus nitroreducens TaxID=2018668 RepID=A0ABT8R1K6_9FIRM|nr:hypothetical protein [Desulfosporosinus nitroreducens]MDO0826006.1 hypothetical protein [Desulfosporosinus nitroreducens]